MSLRRFIIRRILVSVPVLFGVSVLTFGLVHFTPGDVVDTIVAARPNLPEGEAARLRRQYGLNRPVYVQYFDWITDMLQGDFGETYTMGPDVRSAMTARLPETVILGLFAWVFAMVIAIPGGMYSAIRRGQLGDDVGRFFALAGISIPNFWLGLMLIAIFGVELGWFSILPPQKDLFTVDMMKWLILPGIAVGTARASGLMRIMRTTMAQELNKEYVTAARAKGLPERTVIFKHVLRNSLISVTTAAAYITAAIVGGAVVIESVFGWPGLGALFIKAAQAREINLILALTLFTGVAIVIANLLADIVYALLDPRIRDDY
jgi:peptide/nickel transport system permease protein